MTEVDWTTFLIGLSHRYSFLVLSVTVVIGLASFLVKWKRNRERATAGNLLPCWNRALLAVRLAFVVMLGVNTVAMLHIGCASETAWKTDCMVNVKALSQAQLLYAEDYNGRLPLKDWQATTSSYVIGTRNGLKCHWAQNSSSYAMNINLTNKSIMDVPDIESTVLIFEPLNSDVGGSVDIDFRRHGGYPVFGSACGHARPRDNQQAVELVWQLPSTDKG